MECNDNVWGKIRKLMIILAIVGGTILTTYVLDYMAYSVDISTFGSSVEKASLAFSYLLFFVSIAAVVLACIMFCTRKHNRCFTLSLAILTGVAALLAIIVAGLGFMGALPGGILAGAFIVIAVAGMATAQLLKCKCCKKEEADKVEKAEKPAKAEKAVKAEKAEK